MLTMSLFCTVCRRIFLNFFDGCEERDVSLAKPFDFDADHDPDPRILTEFLSPRDRGNCKNFAYK